MSAEPGLEGGCLCGDIRYRLSGPPRLVSCCHCSICRRASGAPMVAWITIRKEQVAFLSGSPTWYKSSEWGRRGFCGKCGTQIVSLHEGYPRYYELTLGSLDHPEVVPLERHVFVPDRLPWILLHDGLPRHRKDARSPVMELPPEAGRTRET